MFGSCCDILSKSHIVLPEVISEGGLPLLAAAATLLIIVKDGKVELGEPARAARLAERRRVARQQIPRIGGAGRGQPRGGGGRGGRR